MFKKACYLTILLGASLSTFAAEYFPDSERIVLNRIKAGDKFYDVELEHTKNSLFKVVSVQEKSEGESDGIFDIDTGRLFLKEVKIVSDTVKAELFRLDNGTFLANLDTTTGGRTDNYNREAVIPPMCYTKTESQFNPCYTCHQKNISGVGHENRMDDGGLQGDYDFSDIGTINRWENLFIDRTQEVNAISDGEILAYIRQDNYSDLAERLESADFKGWIPDLKNLQLAELAFDEQGFAKDGSYWVAFNYKPLPSTFWPTNGSTDDVMIRLPEAFRNTDQGQFSRNVYLANLSILEAAIKNLDELSVPELDETEFNQDLNQDGQLGLINTIKRPETYVGAAESVAVTTFLYPEGTDFLHTVRYVDLDENSGAKLSTRMKEVRYMRKFKFFAKHFVGPFYDGEHFEKEQGHLPYYNSQVEKGLVNDFGWVIQGFIENESGQLRSLNYEENFFCMGCHSTVGSTIDKVFSFARKVEGAEGWGYIDLKKIKDVPAKGETEGEYKKYLSLVGGGDEFRNNPEMIERWFNESGNVNDTAVDSLENIYQLITPSRERALMLNKAYQVIVKEQSFIRGRDATVKPVTNVLKTINTEIPPLPEELHQERDIRLDWSSQSD